MKYYSQNRMAIMSSRQEIFGNIPELKTERLILRKVLLSDARDMFEYANVPDVSKYLAWRAHRSPEDTHDFILKIIQNYMDEEAATWGIELAEENKFIGTIGFLYWDEENYTSEVGFALSNKYWNRGIITEALWKVISFGFTRMNLNRITARTRIENTASQRVLEKLGFKYEGVLRESMIIKGVFTDLKLFSLLRRDFFR